MEQESFLSNEQQKKMEMYEHDADFAHVIASRLNQLIDEGVLTVQDVERASHEILDEFLFRFHNQIIYGSFSDTEKDKFKRFFRGEPTAPVNLKEKGPVGEQYVAMMQKLLRKLKKIAPTLSGMILYGSRMGNYAGRVSDCDCRLVFEEQILRLKPLYDVVPEIIDKIGKKYMFQNLSVRMDQHGSLTIERLKRLLKEVTQGYPVGGGLLWGWNSRRVRYIGDEEKNINKQIQQALNSDEFKQYKEETLNRIKELVKQQAHMYL